VFRRRKSAQNEPELETALEAETTDVEADELDEDAAVEAVETDTEDDVDRDDEATDRSGGPYDVSEVPDDGLARLDLGGLRVPGVEGMELRLEVDEQADQVVAVSVVTSDSAMQLMAFAAPRTDGIWDDVRGEIRANLAGSGLVDEVNGAFGRELHATLTAADENGRTTMQPVRFVGVDGPRWFVRGLFSGAAARETAAAAPLEAVLRACVVVRGNDPMAPGDPLPLHVPTEVPEGMAQREEEAGEGRRKLPPPERGPEITEIR
jgi:hypothetical protein